MDIPNVLTLWAVIVALMSSISSLRLNYKNLEQSEKNLETQLIYEDRKRALIELYNLVDFPEKKEGQTNEEINNEISFKLDQIKTFKENPVTTFLPPNTSNLLYNSFGALHELYIENNLKREKLKEELSVLKEELELLDEKTEELEEGHEYSDITKSMNKIRVQLNEIEIKSNGLEEEKFNKYLDFKKEVRQNIEHNLVNFQEDD